MLPKNKPLARFVKPRTMKNASIGHWPAKKADALAVCFRPTKLQVDEQRQGARDDGTQENIRFLRRCCSA